MNTLILAALALPFAGPTIRAYRTLRTEGCPLPTILGITAPTAPTWVHQRAEYANVIVKEQ